jgi:Family of unknown function (DUF5681)
MQIETKMNTKTNSTQFAKGTSGNPSGRPRGSRNKAALMMESLLEGEVEKLTRKVVELALAGDPQVLRLAIDRLLPPQRDRLVTFDFPPIESLADVAAGMNSIMAAVSAGEITPKEGEVIARILAEHANILTAQDLQVRVEKLEQGALAYDYQVPTLKSYS